LVYFDEEDIDIGNELLLPQGINLDQEFTSSGALVYLTEHVLTTDTDTLLQFVEYHGINDIDDFKSFDELDFIKDYSVIDPPSNRAFSSISIKKLLAVQTRYGTRLQDYNGDPFLIYYSLTTASLTSWRRTTTTQQFAQQTSSVSFIETPTAMVTTPVPAPSTFWHSNKINISDYPKLEDETQWRAFERLVHSAAASHDTIDVLNPHMFLLFMI
jgi:hypothetical protein